MSSDNTTHDNTEYAIEVNGLGKCYQIYDKPSDRLKQMLVRGRKQYYKEFWALKDVSFKIKKGETVGIIGRNGSGKSTLLQMICGTLNPTSGQVRIKGRVAALLELGSGFNPEFTGRENVYLNASVLGLTKDEIDARYDAITAFADIGDFIDQPVKTYSSGMTVRLAFAVQSQVDPDILVVDEALAVGDAKFQAKCFERLRQLKESGTSILLVTHSNEQIVTHCNQAMLLNAGRALEYGEPRQVSNRYMDLLFGKTASDTVHELSATDATLDVQTPEAVALAATHLKLSTRQDVFHTHQGYNPHEYRWGDKRTCITDFLLQADGQDYPAFINTNQKLVLTLAVTFSEDVFRPIFGFTLKTKEGVTVYGTNSEISDVMSLLGSLLGVAALQNIDVPQVAVMCSAISIGVMVLTITMILRPRDSIVRWLLCGVAAVALFTS